MRRARLAIVLVVAIAAVSWGAWFAWRRAASRPHVESGACAGCNLLLITIDTLRSDRLHAFGGAEGLTPNLDRLASEGLRLTRTYAPAPLTLPSHASMLTAVPPPVHGARANGLFRLGPERPTLATVLKSAGYRTGAFVGAFVLDARFGLGRGFDVYDDRYGEARSDSGTEGAERRAEDVIRPAREWILNSAPSTEHPAPGTSTHHPAPSTHHPAPSTHHPYFAWIHLYDPHEPYRAPEPYASRFPAYDAEVAYTDAQIGILLTDLRAAGMLDRTVMAVAADHGESLGEHGERTHGVFTYDVTMRVPWILWAGARVSGSSDALVRLIDLAPTVLDLVHVTPPREFEGTSIVPLVQKGEGASTAYIESMDANLTRNWAPLTGIVSGRHKLIDLPIPELYDLVSDPSETTNIFSRDGERARTLQSLLRDAIAGFAARATAPDRTTLSAEARQRLQALGYVASTAVSATRSYTDADDPKRLIDAANELNQALADFRRGSLEPAMAAVASIIQQHPTFTTAYGVLASMQRDMGNLNGAIATLEAIVRTGVADQSVLVVLAGYLREAGALARAADLLEAVIQSHPDYAEAHNSLGTVYSGLQQHDRAREAFRKVLELDPTAATAYENLGVDELATGEIDRAIADLSRALEMDPGLARAHNAIAVAFSRRREIDQAVVHWKRAIAINPRLFDALYNLGTTLASAGRRDEARPYLERFINEAPPYRYGADIERIHALLGK